MAMTRDEVEQAGRALGDARWNIWMQCGLHNWRALPRTDSDEHYCPNCYTIWTADGAIHNVPQQPKPQH
jgi:hypothetical protein